MAGLPKRVPIQDFTAPKEVVQGCLKWDPLQRWSMAEVVRIIEENFTFPGNDGFRSTTTHRRICDGTINAESPVGPSPKKLRKHGSNASLSGASSSVGTSPSNFRMHASNPSLSASSSASNTNTCGIAPRVGRADSLKRKDVKKVTLIVSKLGARDPTSRYISKGACRCSGNCGAYRCKNNSNTGRTNKDIIPVICDKEGTLGCI